MALTYGLGNRTQIIPLNNDVVRGLTVRTGHVRHYALPGNRGLGSEDMDGLCVAFDARDVVYTHPDLPAYVNRRIEVSLGGGSTVVITQLD